MASRLSMIVQYVRNVERAAAFYADGLGCQVNFVNEHFAEIGDSPPLFLQRTESEAMLSTAYSPCLTFIVEDLDQTLPRTLELGATMDGGVSYTERGKKAKIRSPDGLMISLAELPPNDEAF